MVDPSCKQVQIHSEFDHLIKMLCFSTLEVNCIETYLDRLDVLLVVDRHTCWVQLKAGTELVRYVCTNSLIPTITEPHLKKALLGAK